MMNGYLLDTNICIYLLKGQRGIVEKIEVTGCDNCFITDVTLAELWFGAYNSNRIEQQKRGISYLEQLFNVISIKDSVELFGSNKAYLKSMGTIIDDFDILIGSTAIKHNLIMVTENVRHLSRLPGIIVENWAS
ncbi:MAG: type II toxin-antitoxin system VapC family toxin [Prevotella sp.]